MYTAKVLEENRTLKSQIRRLTNDITKHVRAPGTPSQPLLAACASCELLGSVVGCGAACIMAT